MLRSVGRAPTTPAFGHQVMLPVRVYESYSINEAEMMWQRRHDSSSFFVRYSAGGAPEQLTRAEHGPEVSGLGEVERIVVFCV